MLCFCFAKASAYLRGRRAEIFVLITTGSIPTLKPIWSQVRGKISKVGTYVNSKKYENGSSNYPYDGSNSVGITHTHVSKASKGFGRRQPGTITIALDDIDGMTKAEAGSSTESILRNDKDSHDPTLPNPQPSSSKSHGTPKPEPSPHSPRGHHPHTAIHVEQDFLVSYSYSSSKVGKDSGL